ncbi:MAG: dihydropteroate synthase, partial [Pseudomonadota bacterium]
HNPVYTDVVTEVFDYLAGRISACEEAGIAREHIVVDPGIGFGKTLEHNLQLLKHLSRFQALEVPILLGVSRKSFIAKLDHDVPADQRLGGSIAAALAGLQAGADILRVHDVAATRQAITIWQAIDAAGVPPQNEEAVA